MMALRPSNESQVRPDLGEVLVVIRMYPRHNRLSLDPSNAPRHYLMGITSG